MLRWKKHFLPPPAPAADLAFLCSILNITRWLQNPSSGSHIRYASSWVSYTFLHKIEPGSELFIMWNLHGTQKIFSRFFSRRLETFADNGLSPPLRHSRCGLLWWSGCSATQGNRQPKSVPAAFLSWMLVAERWELHGTPVMGFLRVLKLPCLPN